jgi:hypothetical protein
MMDAPPANLPTKVDDFVRIVGLVPEEWTIGPAVSRK